MPRSRSKFRLRSSKLSTSLSQLDSMSTLSTSGAVSTTCQNCASQDKKTNQQNHNVLLSAMLKSVVVDKQVRIGTVFGRFARSNLSFLQTRGFTFFHSHSVRRVLNAKQTDSCFGQETRIHTKGKTEKEDCTHEIGALGNDGQTQGPHDVPNGIDLKQQIPSAFVLKNYHSVTHALLRAAPFPPSFSCVPGSVWPGFPHSPRTGLSLPPSLLEEAR